MPLACFFQGLCLGVNQRRRRVCTGSVWAEPFIKSVLKIRSLQSPAISQSQSLHTSINRYFVVYKISVFFRQMLSSKDPRACFCLLLGIHTKPHRFSTATIFALRTQTPTSCLSGSSLATSGWRSTSGTIWISTSVLLDLRTSGKWI